MYSTYVGTHSKNTTAAIDCMYYVLFLPSQNITTIVFTRNIVYNRNIVITTNIVFTTNLTFNLPQF